MEFRFYAIIIINVLSTALLLAIYDGIMLRRVLKKNEFSYDVKKDKQEVYDDDNSEIPRSLTSYEIERMHREREFDERIENIRKEIESYRGTTAEILDPNIYNLPHDVIRTSEEYYEEEYVE